MTVRDAAGAAVRRDLVDCAAVLGEVQIPRGTVRMSEALVPLIHENAETGVPDGVSLPAGVYNVSVRWLAEGPQALPHAPSIVFDGGEPFAQVPIRIGTE